MTRPRGLRTWVEVDTQAVKNNYRFFRQRLSPKTKLMAVVKSNAYGHDLHQFAPLVARLGADWLGVDSVTEALALRRAGIKIPVLILGYTLPERLGEARREGVSVTVSGFEALKAVSRMRPGENPLRLHIKVDTGMHRQGFLGEDAPAVAKRLKEMRNITVEGIYSHFGQAENHRRSDKQLQKFLRVTEIFWGVEIRPIRHLAATGGVLAGKENHLDMVRVGLGLYGLYPSPALQPALTWKTIVGEIKKIPKGEAVGYDFTEILKKPSRLVVLPVGYWHGYPRHLSSRGRVSVRGHRARVVGRVSMDMIVADVTAIPGARVGDEVELLGRRARAIELAALAGTNSYEIVTRLNPLMRRFYV